MKFSKFSFNWAKRVPERSSSAFLHKSKHGDDADVQSIMNQSQITTGEVTPIFRVCRRPRLSATGDVDLHGPHGTDLIMPIGRMG